MRCTKHKQNELAVHKTIQTLLIKLAKLCCGNKVKDFCRIFKELANLSSS